MFNLRTGYFITGIVTGFLLIVSFLWSLPDGKLHITVCDVGQGDASYVRFPDGRDMLVDGGPNDKVLGCLAGHMPFWDRNIDIVILSHPQKDHMQGLLSVLTRYHVGYVVRSDIQNATDGFQQLTEVVKNQKIPEKLVTVGEQIRIGQVSLRVIWPSADQIARMTPPVAQESSHVLGASTGDLNDGSVVFWLRYGSFDALFPGDADRHVEGNYTGGQLADGTVELLKVPHHGSKTGMTSAFLDWLKPKLAVISIGKNAYGHPSAEALQLLATYATQVLRTDEAGDIEVVSDGKNWQIHD